MDPSHIVGDLRSFLLPTSELGSGAASVENVRIPASKVLKWVDGRKASFTAPCDAEPSGLAWLRYELPSASPTDVANALAFWQTVRPSPRICYSCPVAWPVKNVSQSTGEGKAGLSVASEDTCAVMPSDVGQVAGDTTSQAEVELEAVRNERLLCL